MAQKTLAERDYGMTAFYYVSFLCCIGGFGIKWNLNSIWLYSLYVLFEASVEGLEVIITVLGAVSNDVEMFWFAVKVKTVIVF